MTGSAQTCFIPSEVGEAALSRDRPLGQESMVFPRSLGAARTVLLLAGTSEATTTTLLTLEAMDLPPRTSHKLSVISSGQDLLQGHS